MLKSSQINNRPKIVQSSHLLDLLNDNDMLASDENNLNETNDRKSMEGELKKDKRGAAREHSVSSNSSNISAFKLNLFYEHPDNAIKFILYLGRMIFIFLILAIIGVFYYSLMTVDKIK